MKLADLATGSDWIVWIVFVIFAVLSIVLLSGHGSWFISGYNTASKEEKKKYGNSADKLIDIPSKTSYHKNRMGRVWKVICAPGKHRR